MYLCKSSIIFLLQPSKSTSWRWRKLGIDQAACNASQPTAIPNNNDELDTLECEQADRHELAVDVEDFEPAVEPHLAGNEREPSESRAVNNDSFFESVGSGSDREEACPSNSDSSQDSSGGDCSSSDGEFTESSEESGSGHSDVDSECNESVSDVTSELSDALSLSDEEEELRPLYDECSFSVDEAVLDFLTDHIQNHETLNSLKSHLKTFLKYIPKHNAMPKNSNQLQDYVLKLAPSYKETAHYYCSKCHLYAKNTNDPCRACENKDFNAFYDFSLEEQLKFYYEECELAEVLDKYHDMMHSKDGKLRDITDGSEYIRVRINDRYSVTLMMNTDGVSIRKSSKTSVWPIMFSICEIPSYLRQRFMIVSGIWCDVGDPPMNTLLKPIVEEICKIHQKGGVSWVHPVTKVQHSSMVHCPVICADAPARAKIQNILSHQGKTSCNTCEQKKRRIGLTPEELNLRAAGKRVQRKRAFVFQETPARLRTDERMRRQARKAVNLPPKETVKGVKGPTRVAFIPKLDLSTCVYGEYMHGICLGIVRQFLNLWFFVPGDWNISKHLEEIDEILRSITPTSDIGRLARGIKDLKYWKASELRAWLLFYSLPCISGKLPPKYVQHWTLLVAAIFLLLQEEISEHDLLMAESMLRMFVRDIATLYRLQDYSYNVHQLLHLTLYVRWWGNLWSTSAFRFENYNGILAHLIHGTKNPAKELMRNLRIAHGLEILRNRVKGAKMETQRNQIEPLNSRCCVKIPQDDQDFLKVNFPEINQTFLRADKNKVIYTSKLYGRECKRNNYTVKFKTATVSGYGQIKYFIVQGGKVCAVLDKFRIRHTAMFTHNASGARVNHIVPIERVPSDFNIVVNIDDILAKVIPVGNYVCYLPNKYERNNL